MKTFNYVQEGNTPLVLDDLYRLLNNYRVWKYIIGMLLMLNKTQLSDYKILEPGCGGGDKLRSFTELRARPGNCYGFDVSQKSIALCKSLSPDTMNFQVGSIMEIPFGDNVFDIVLCSNVFNCFPADTDIKMISEELRRVIRDNGVLLVLDINEHFSELAASNKAIKAKGLRGFDTAKNELESLLSSEFTLFRRINAFVADYYTVGNRIADIADLPAIDQAMDQGSFRCAYNLYSFTPKN